jgi:hypothetical protein
MAQEEKFDGIMYNMVQSSGGYEGFFDTVFGFLRRKTDFFTDFKKAEQVIAAAGKKHIEIYSKEHKVNETNAQSVPTQKEAPKKETVIPAPVVTKAPHAEVPKPEEKKIPENQTSNPNQLAPEIKSTDKDAAEVSDKLAPGPGNGSKTDKYIWTQSLEELQVTVPIHNNLRARDLNIKLDVNHCHIATKDGKIVFLDGEWNDKIHPDEAVWTIEESNGSKVVELILTKWKNTQNWWNCLLKGEPVIDTQKINPESSKLSDLDGEMKSTVEKMMFDMNQKQKGLPSSDELQKQDKLKEFMKAHPEMDFSKAKFG